MYNEYIDYSADGFEEEEEALIRQYIKQPCLAKLVVDKTRNNQVIGFHYLGPNAGEITQGFALALKCGVTKQQFDALV